MTSFQFAPSRRKRIAGRFLTRVRRELQKAFTEEKAARGTTQAQLARDLGIHRAVVCRQLAGTSNLTLRTLADYAWALNRDLVFSMPKPAPGNHFVAGALSVAEPALQDDPAPTSSPEILEIGRQPCPGKTGAIVAPGSDGCGHEGPTVNNSGFLPSPTPNLDKILSSTSYEQQPSIVRQNQVLLPA